MLSIEYFTIRIFQHELLGKTSAPWLKRVYNLTDQWNMFWHLGPGKIGSKYWRGRSWWNHIEISGPSLSADVQKFLIDNWYVWHRQRSTKDAKQVFLNGVLHLSNWTNMKSHNSRSWGFEWLQRSQQNQFHISRIGITGQEAFLTSSSTPAVGLICSVFSLVLFNA